jgi:hypothetical protein
MKTSEAIAAAHEVGRAGSIEELPGPIRVASHTFAIAEEECKVGAALAEACLAGLLVEGSRVLGLIVVLQSRTEGDAPALVSRLAGTTKVAGCGGAQGNRILTGQEVSMC